MVFLVDSCSSGLRKSIRSGKPVFTVPCRPVWISLSHQMYLGFYSFYKHYNRNRMLDDPTGPIGDNIMYGFYFAGQRLRELGHKVATLDMDDLEKFDAALFFDHPTLLTLISANCGG